VIQYVEVKVPVKEERKGRTEEEKYAERLARDLERRAERRKAKLQNKDLARAPTYYNADIDPLELLKNRESKQLRRIYMNKVLGGELPVKEQANMFLLPVPENLGFVQCTIERNTSGFNKLWPKYTMTLSDDKQMMLEAKKLASSKTPHYRIELQSQNVS
jgi:hypothetical protein